MSPFGYMTKFTKNTGFGYVPPYEGGKGQNALFLTLGHRILSHDGDCKEEDMIKNRHRNHFQMQAWVEGEMGP